MIGVTSSGDLSKTRNALQRMLRGDIYKDLERYGQMGVDALSNATPVDTSETSHSWKYRVVKGKQPSIEWYNTASAGRVSVAVLIQYGHGTGTGGFVQGRDFINPAMRPIFDKIADDVWKKVKQ